MFAVYQALKLVPKDTPLLIKSDLRWVINHLTKYRQENQNNGYIEVAHAQIIKATDNLLKERHALTYIEWVKAHIGTTGNKGPDLLAKLGIGAPQSLDLEPTPIEFNLTGANLAMASQKLLYKGISASKELPRLSKTAKDNLIAIQEAAKSLSGRLHTKHNIFTLITKDKDLLRKTRVFLWKMTHGAHKCGKYWLQMQSDVL